MVEINMASFLLNSFWIAAEVYAFMNYRFRKYCRSTGGHTCLPKGMNLNELLLQINLSRVETGIFLENEANHMAVTQITGHYKSYQCFPWFKSILDMYIVHMMTSSNGNIFRVTGHLCGEFTGFRWIPHTKASDAGLWCFLWSASE